MCKYTNEQEKVQELIDKYQKNLDSYLNKNYNETQLRIDFVNPFFEILGWDVDNKQKLPPKSREVIHEASVNIEEDGKYRTKKPDYAFKAGTEIIYYLETKKPSVDINIENQPAFQLRRYGWSGNLNISILTNFNDLYIYDCSIPPKESDSNRIALVKHYNYKDYIEKFDEIYDFLSKNAVLKGLFQEKTREINKFVEKETFDNYFLIQIKKWRLNLGQDIYKNNSYVTESALNIFVQRILNRILFLRICEDRNLEVYETLRTVKDYKQLKELFFYADKKYNSGLFSIIDKEQINLSDTVLISIFQELYYPQSPYEFSVVDSYIMGQIYELFLDEELIIENNKVSAKIKQDIVDIHGTVNTPKNVTDIIVEKSLDKWIQSHSYEDICNIKLADICCGSGNFLISAYEYLINYHTNYFQENNLTDNLQKGNLFYSNNKKEYLLSLKIRKQILKKNIFGCDINPLACEITKFNLLLKTIEDIPEIEIDELYNIQKEKALPSLEANIKNGNSLIDDNYLKFNKNLYEDINLLRILNPFNWDREFPFGKFDVIVGNPPYIRVQKLVHYVENEYSYYKSPCSGYETAQTELTDKYYLFVERIKQLLNRTGVAGVIIPHKFMLIKSGSSLRTLLTKNHNIVEIINFGTHQIFKGRDTYTCILIFSNVEQQNFQIAFINDLPQFLFTHKCLEKTFPIEYLSSSPWVFLPSEIEKKLEKINDKTVQLKSIAEIFVGLQTSNDKIYILTPKKEDEKYIYCSENDGTDFKIEKQILKYCIYDIQLHCYEKIKPNSCLIYPYYEKEGKPILYSIEEMKNNFPETYKYLLRHKKKLDERNINNRNASNWYQFGRSQSLKRFFRGEHLIWAVLALSGNYVYDNNLITFTGGGNGPFYGLTIKENSLYSIFYIQALLNHWLLELLVRNKASNFRGDYYSHGKQFIAELPIRRIDFNNPKEKKAHDDIVSKVINLMKLSENKKNTLVKSDIDIIDRAIQSEKRILENLIDELYDVIELKARIDNETTR